MDLYREAPELGIPEVKPAIESIRGRWVRKASPKTRHAILQGRLYTWLAQWARGGGEVGLEWRFYMLADGDRPSSLVPDVAYVSAGRMPPAIGELREMPTIAPDIAVEVLSPYDSRRILKKKIALYFQFGSRLVVIVDPEGRTVHMTEPPGERVFSEGDVALCAAYADLRLDVSELFSRL